jgi:hypothetical protein
MAGDFLCMALYGMEERKEAIPPESNIKGIRAEDNDVVTLISVDTDDYRRYYEKELLPNEALFSQKGRARR